MLISNCLNPHCYNPHYIFRFAKDSIMRILICGVILLFSILVAIFAQDYNENDYPEDYPENGNRAVNSDWFWMGSNLVSLGNIRESHIIIHILIRMLKSN